MGKVLFSEEELQQEGVYLKASEPVDFPAVPKYKRPISPKENLLSAIGKKGAMWFPSETLDMFSLEPRINLDHIARGEVRDLEKAYADEEKGGPDLFGVNWVYVPLVKGSMVKPGAPIMEDANDWRRLIRFPDIDAMDWENCKSVNAPFNGEDRSLSVTFQNGMFERLISFMDFENASIALIDEEQKDAVHELFDALADMYIKMISRYLDCFDLDGVVFHDDWGAQRGPLFSLDTCMEMIVPHIKKVVDYCHSRGLWFRQHSCGKNEPLVPAMLAEGIDIWYPQKMNDMKTLYEQYGDKLIFGVYPPEVKPDDSDAVMEKRAEAFVDAYKTHFREKPIIVNDFLLPQKYKEYIYKYSRMSL